VEIVTLYILKIKKKIKKNMIKVYSMPTCPDCEAIDKLVAGNPKFQVINIGEHVRYLKEFLKLRDSRKEFDRLKKINDVCIPCFVLEDGSITFNPEEVGLHVESKGASCSLNGSGC
jgi:hypothetical protein